MQPKSIKLARATISLTKSSWLARASILALLGLTLIACGGGGGGGGGGSNPTSPVTPTPVTAFNTVAEFSWTNPNNVTSVEINRTTYAAATGANIIGDRQINVRTIDATPENANYTKAGRVDFSIAALEIDDITDGQYHVFTITPTYNITSNTTARFTSTTTKRIQLSFPRITAISATKSADNTTVTLNLTVHPDVVSSIDRVDVNVTGYLSATGTEINNTKSVEPRPSITFGAGYITITLNVGSDIMPEAGEYYGFSVRPIFTGDKEGVFSAFTRPRIQFSGATVASGAATASFTFAGASERQADDDFDYTAPININWSATSDSRQTSPTNITLESTSPTVCSVNGDGVEMSGPDDLTQTFTGSSRVTPLSPGTCSITVTTTRGTASDDLSTTSTLSVVLPEVAPVIYIQSLYSSNIQSRNDVNDPLVTQIINLDAGIPANNGLADLAVNAPHATFATGLFFIGINAANRDPGDDEANVTFALSGVTAGSFGACRVTEVEPTGRAVDNSFSNNGGDDLAITTYQVTHTEAAGGACPAITFSVTEGDTTSMLVIPAGTFMFNPLESGTTSVSFTFAGASEPPADDDFDYTAPINISWFATSVAEQISPTNITLKSITSDFCSVSEEIITGPAELAEPFTGSSKITPIRPGTCSINVTTMRETADANLSTTSTLSVEFPELAPNIFLNYLIRLSTPITLFDFTLPGNAIFDREFNNPDGQNLNLLSETPYRTTTEEVFVIGVNATNNDPGDDEDRDVDVTFSSAPANFEGCQVELELFEADGKRINTDYSNTPPHASYRISSTDPQGATCPDIVISVEEDGETSTLVIPAGTFIFGLGSDGDGIANAEDVDDDGNGLIEVRNATELNAIRNNLAGTGLNLDGTNDNTTGCGNGSTITSCSGYELVANIDLLDYPNWDPIGPFAATFNGNGYNIIGLTIDTAAALSGVGFFSELLDSSSIDNVNLININITAPAATNVGALVGLVSATQPVTISGVVVIGGQVVGGTNVGGIIGSAGDITMRSSFADLNKINGASNLGGLVGLLNSAGGASSIIASEADIDAIESSGNAVGGLVGSAQARVDIRSSAAQIGLINGTDNLGGLVGESTNNLAITNSYATTQRIDGSTNLGGLVGTGAATIVSSYADNSTVAVNSASRVNFREGVGHTRQRLQSNSSFADIYEDWGNAYCDPATGDYGEITDGGVPDSFQRAWDLGSNSSYPALTCTSISAPTLLLGDRVSNRRTIISNIPYSYADTISLDLAPNYYLLILGEPTTVSIFTEGDAADTVGNLYDSTFELIFTNDDSDPVFNVNFRIEGYLSAGLYYLRVNDFHNRPSPYTLKVERE